MKALCKQLIRFSNPAVAHSWLMAKDSHFFPRLRCIIDCTEAAVSRPLNLSTQQEVWSDYKQDFTLKFLVCVNPHGAVMFVSPVYGGRVTDKQITLESAEVPTTCIRHP
ncbi:uncharacterized protein LOC144121146 [Amblyomma americanum]